MGLTGIIYTAKIKLKKIMSDIIFEEKIKNYNLKQTLKCINSSKDWEYNVAWIDTSTNLKEIGRSILSRGYFIKKKQNKLNFAKKAFFIKRLPNFFPSFFMSRVF